MNEKPIAGIPITTGGKRYRLYCQNQLSKIDPSHNYHALKKVRHPYGIYNISISNCLRHLKTLIEKSLDACRLQSLNDFSEKFSSEFLDAVIMTLYGAAEHIDDVKSIASTFFNDDQIEKRNPSNRELHKKLKIIKDDITSLTNNIKHNHGRLRLHLVEFVLPNKTLVMPGFYCEAYLGDALGPSPIFHPKKGSLISLSAHIWEHLNFLFEVSESVSDFLNQLRPKEINEPISALSTEFYDVVELLLNLPTYTFDCPHPFVKMPILVGELQRLPNSLIDLPGSIYLPWNSFNLSLAQIGNSCSNFVGDGVTKSFRLIDPKLLSLVHWIRS